jgi:hypothetical protein
VSLLIKIVQTIAVILIFVCMIVLSAMNFLCVELHNLAGLWTTLSTLHDRAVAWFMQQHWLSNGLPLFVAAGTLLGITGMWRNARHHLHRLWHLIVHRR